MLLKEDQIVVVVEEEVLEGEEDGEVGTMEGVEDMEEGEVDMTIETMEIIKDTIEIMADKALHIIEEDVEDIMTIDIMIMIKTSNIITVMTMKGKVNGMEEEMVIIGKEDTLKIMGNLAMEVGREDVEEGTMEGV